MIEMKKIQIKNSMTYEIFISYSTFDIDTAKRITDYLSRIRGVTVFLSESNLIAGRLSDILVEKIKSCDLFIVLYSRNSHNSIYVQQEIGVAKGNNKLIIPILLDSEAKPNAMLEGMRYLTIYDENKARENMPMLFNYIAQQLQKKADTKKTEGLLVLGAMLFLYLLSE